MTRSHTLATTIIASALMVSASVVAPSASAQPRNTSSTAGTLLPVILWAATGAVIGAVAWPMIVGGAAAPAASAGIMNLGAFLNTGAVTGAIVGGGGYLLSR